MKINTNECDVLLVGYEDEENLGLRYISAFLNEHGVKTKIEPYNSTSKENILKRVQKGNPKIIGFSLIFQRMLFDFAELITYLRKNGVESHFTMGGHFPSMEFKEILKIIPGLDTVVRHEGEQTMLDLYENLNDPLKWPQIKGIAYRLNGEIKVTSPRPLIENLDSIPFPVRDHFINHMNMGIASIIASRGCHYNCSFCSIRQFYKDAPGTIRRSRSPSNVANEMESLFRFGVRIFSFRDDDFSMRGRSQLKWIEEFAKELEKRNLSRKNIIWRIACRIDEVNEKICSRLEEVGLAFLYLGMESGSNHGLETFNKHYNVNDIYRSLNIIEKVGMNFDYGFMLLDPDTTFNSLKENLNFLKRLGNGGRVPVHFTKMLPYAGTPISMRLKEEGRLKGTISSPDYSYTDSRIELMETFLKDSFHDMLFKTGSLMNKIQFTQFNSVVLDKLFWDVYDTHSYTNAVESLIDWCNETTLETLNSAIKFMENTSYQDIIKDWHVLKELTDKEISAQTSIEMELDYLSPMDYWKY